MGATELEGQVEVRFYQKKVQYIVTVYIYVLKLEELALQDGRIICLLVDIFFLILMQLVFRLFDFFLHLLIPLVCKDHGNQLPFLASHREAAVSLKVLKVRLAASKITSSRENLFTHLQSRLS